MLYEFYFWALPERIDAYPFCLLKNVDDRGYCARDGSGNPFLSEARKRLERTARSRVCGERPKKQRLGVEPH